MGKNRPGLPARTARILHALGLMVVLVAAAMFTTGCDSDSNDDDPSTLEFTFEGDAQGWEGEFADYAVDRDTAELELEFDLRALPDSLDPDAQGLYLAGRNLSDDLFMYVKREFTDLIPETSYRITVQADIASNSPSGCAGIGGAPGEAVVVKFGAAQSEPVPVDEEGIYRLSVDKETPTDSLDAPNDVTELGNVANGVEECTGTVPYRMITLDNLEEPLDVISDETGRLWLYVGTDSGFEGKTTLYYDTITVTLSPITTL